MNLYAKLQREQVDDAWRANEDEEYEDSQGNVLNKKTFMDLARQGLL